MTIRFPHPLSAWWALVLPVIGWGSLLVADVLNLKSLALGWMLFDIATIGTYLAMASVLVQIVRLLIYAIRVPPKSK
jgi:hypothetical protein